MSAQPGTGALRAERAGPGRGGVAGGLRGLVRARHGVGSGWLAWWESVRADRVPPFSAGGRQVAGRGQRLAGLAGGWVVSGCGQPDQARVLGDDADPPAAGPLDVDGGK